MPHRFYRALVDADGIVFKLGFCASSRGWPLTTAINKYAQVLNTLSKNDVFEVTTISLFYTARGKKFREEFGKDGAEYKQSRKKTGPKPLWIEEMMEAYPRAMLSAADGEADDYIAIERNAEGYTPESVVVSNDKDLLQIPGWHARWDGDKYNLVFVSMIEGYRNFFTQILTGDRADNVKGIKGCGPITAKRILKNAMEPEEMYARVIETYTDTYKNTHSIDDITDMIYNRANLLWLRRKLGQVWTPPVPQDD